jgi:hypothetical protein
MHHVQILFQGVGKICSNTAMIDKPTPEQRASHRDDFTECRRARLRLQREWPICVAAVMHGLLRRALELQYAQCDAPLPCSPPPYTRRPFHHNHCLRARRACVTSPALTQWRCRACWRSLRTLSWAGGRSALCTPPWRCSWADSWTKPPPPPTPASAAWRRGCARTSGACASGVAQDRRAG